MNTLKLTFLFILIVSPCLLFSQTLAFPGAEGFGKYTTGGRGGRVIEVTSLEDLTRSGHTEVGSLRAALNTSGDDPITIIFKVSGLIELDSELKSGRSNMTIAGQSAPGDGICIKNESIKLSGSNLIIRYVRFRPGDELKGHASGLNIENAHNIIVDHCSMSWAIEENMGFYDNKYTTVQWCILSEGLYDSYHSKGPRGYGSQWGGQFASYHHNILAKNRSRSPRINGSRAHDTLAIVDFRNNVIFNWNGTGAIYGGEEEIPGGKSETNFVNNYYIPGPASSRAFARPSYVTDGNEAQGFGAWYFSGNYMQGVEGGMNDDNWLGVEIINEIGTADNIRSDVEFDVEEIPTETAQDALESVTEKAGATLPKRDAVDVRIISEMKGESGMSTSNGIIDSQEDVGGWPTYETLLPLDDTDGDGIPDEYEETNGLDANDPEDGKEIQGSGYSNLEIYLNGIIGITGKSSLEVLGTAPKEFISIYPNPAKDLLIVITAKDLNGVEIFDATGKRVLTSLSEDLNRTGSVDIRSLHSGIYIIKCTFQNGEEVSRRIIKK